MILFIIYLAVALALLALCGYYHEEMDSVELTVILPLLWPIILPCVLIFVIGFLPYLFGTYRRARKRKEITFINFVKEFFS